MLVFAILLHEAAVLRANEITNATNSESDMRSIRSPKTISIKPMDSKQQRSFRTPPINPDSELIYSPSQGRRYQYEQVMERLRDVNQPNKSGQSQSRGGRNKKKSFNFLNFDAYLVKPMNVNYKRVFATLKPEAEKLLRIMNKSDGEVSEEVKNRMQTKGDRII